MNPFSGVLGFVIVMIALHQEKEYLVICGFLIFVCGFLQTISDRLKILIELHGGEA